MGRFALICLLALSTTTGCSELKSLLKDASKPSARIVGANIQNLNLEGLGLVFDVEVTNPYAVPLPLVNLDYALATNGTKFLSGNADVQGSIPAKGSKTIQVPAAVTFAGLLNTIKGVKPGSVIPYTADLGLSVDAPAVGRLNLPIRKTGELPIPTVPTIELAGVDWKELNLQNAEAVLKIKIGNTNDFPIDLSKLDYGLSLGGSRVAGAAVNKSTHFGKGKSNTISIPISIKPIDLGLSALRMFSGDGAKYELGGLMDVKTPFGAMSMPFNQSGNAPFTK